AQEIHDDSLQLLAAVQLRAEQFRRTLGESSQRDLLQTLATTVEQAMASLRRLLFDLRPPALEEEGLASTVRQFAHLLFEGADTSYHVRSYLTAEPDEPTKHVLYRVCREAMTNARKHAGARRVDVVFTEERGGVRAKITDDGVGLPRVGRHA